MKHDNYVAINDIIQLRDGSTHKVIDIKDNEVVLQSVSNTKAHQTVKLEILFKQAFIVEFADPIEQLNAETRLGLKTKLAKVYNLDDYRKKVS